MKSKAGMVLFNRLTKGTVLKPLDLNQYGVWCRMIARQIRYDV